MPTIIIPSALRKKNAQFVIAAPARRPLVVRKPPVVRAVIKVPVARLRAVPGAPGLLGKKMRQALSLRRPLG